MFSEPQKRLEFPHLKHDHLTKKQREELLTKLTCEFEAIKFKFAGLVYHTSQSLKTSGKNPGDLHLLIKTYVPEKHEILKYLTTEEKFDKVFDHNYWSFFDYELFALIIKNCCPELNEKLVEYVETFEEYCCRRVSEVPTTFTSVSGIHFIIRVKLGNEFSSYTVNEIKELEASLRKIVKIDLSISNFEPGSIMVVFVSFSEENDMLPLNEKEKDELFELGVLKMYSDNHVYFDYNEYTQTHPKASAVLVYSAKPLYEPETSSAMTMTTTAIPLAEQGKKIYTHLTPNIGKKWGFLDVCVCRGHTLR